MRLFIISCLVLLAMPGCLSTTLYKSYTLDMAPSESAGGAAIAVRHFTLADTLSGASMPIKTGPTTIDYYSSSQWAGSLEDLLREKFQVEFGSTVAGGGGKVMDGHVLAFEQVDIAEGQAAAHAKMEIQVRPADASRYSQALLAKVYDVTVPLEAPTPEGLANGLSRCVEQIAAQLQADLAGLE